MQHRRAEHGVQADQAAGALTDDRRDSHTCHAPPEYCDKQNVQHNVYAGGGGHGDERRGAVAHGPQEAAEQVEAHHQRHAAEDNAQVQAGQMDDFIRRVHQAQHRPQEQLGSDLQHYDGRKGQKQALSGGFTHLRVIPCAKALGDLDTEALRQADGNGQHRPVEPACRGYGSHFRHGFRVADDEGTTSEYSCWKALPAMIGRQNSRMCLVGLPVVMSRVRAMVGLLIMSE